MMSGGTINTMTSGRRSRQQRSNGRKKYNGGTVRAMPGSDAISLDLQVKGMSKPENVAETIDNKQPVQKRVCYQEKKDEVRRINNEYAAAIFKAAIQMSG
jgi:hypothetical protein